MSLSGADAVLSRLRKGVESSGTEVSDSESASSNNDLSYLGFMGYTDMPAFTSDVERLAVSEEVKKSWNIDPE